MDMEAFERAMHETYGPQETTDERRMTLGMHRTASVDVVTLLEGELFAVFETGETLLRAGDSLIQRGTAHAWSNRSDKPATVISVMMGVGG